VAKTVRLLDRCRLCNSKQFRNLIDFGRAPLGNNLQRSASKARKAAKYPLCVRRCIACGHFQLSHAVDPKILYATNYTYFSGIGASFVKHIQTYVNWLNKQCRLPAGSLVVDIGSNDGTCLEVFQKSGFRVCGVDPAQLPVAEAKRKGIPTILSFFDSRTVKRIRQLHGQANLVTSQNVLAHVDDLPAVFRGVHELLKNQGYFCFEIGYFREVLRKGWFDTIYHEHLDYHHATPLARHLGQLGFDLLHLSVQPVQGGSLRLLLRKTGQARINAQASRFLALEKRSVLYNLKFLRVWSTGIRANMTNFRRKIILHRKNGNRVVAYGAPTKAVLLLQVAGLGRREIDFIVDDNLHKVGRYLPNSCIPIRPTPWLKRRSPGVMVLLAWNFVEDILRKVKLLRHHDLKIIVPLPQARELT